MVITESKARPGNLYIMRRPKRTSWSREFRGNARSVRRGTLPCLAPIHPSRAAPRGPHLPLSCLARGTPRSWLRRSEEHTSELQSHSDLVCRLLLEKKKNKRPVATHRVSI